MQIDFADELALALEAGQALVDGILPEPLKIYTFSNTLSAVVNLASVDYTRGLGFATVTLEVKGSEALRLISDVSEPG